jgi:hypothetical protein
VETQERRRGGRPPGRGRKVEPTLSPETYNYLLDLADTGGYGSNPTDVARTLIEEGIRRALADKIIAVRRRGAQVNQ